MRGRQNNLTTKDAANASDVMLGEFCINDGNAVVLFDSKGTSSYMSSQCVTKESEECGVLSPGCDE